MGEFDWELLRSAAELNGATEIALTFADYLDVRNQETRRYDQLQPGTILFMAEIERVSGTPVTPRHPLRSTLGDRPASPLIAPQPAMAARQGARCCAGPV